ncbi:hypothetical protein [Paenibacillus sp. HJGM_3]|uniref:hypothetical protein n=1 Tax=Paenibacillus sp. HJGM_3 TaxID=3379816 RepID=UPI00385D885E
MLSFDRYIGYTVELIYMDGLERITQRMVVVQKVRGDVLDVYCLQRRQPRRLRLDRILSVRKVGDRRIS